MEISRVFRDISVRVVRRYAEALPEASTNGNEFFGPGWRLRLEELPRTQVGGLSFSRVRLTLTGEPEPVTRIWAMLEPKFYRGGA
jgi:hypothetical protein